MIKTKRGVLNVKQGKIWLSFLGVGGLALSTVGCMHPADAATHSALPTYGVAQAHILLADNGPVLPSQRPRYLSTSAGSANSRFSRSGGENDWGLSPITPDEGIVTLKPGESYRTAAEADVGARAAGATHGNALVSSAVGMAK
jgi:hypothetical protein